MNKSTYSNFQMVREESVLGNAGYFCNRADSIYAKTYSSIDEYPHFWRGHSIFRLLFVAITPGYMDKFGAA